MGQIVYMNTNEISKMPGFADIIIWLIVIYLFYKLTKWLWKHGIGSLMGGDS